MGWGGGGGEADSSQGAMVQTPAARSSVQRKRYIFLSERKLRDASLVSQAGGRLHPSIPMLHIHSS